MTNTPKGIETVWHIQKRLQARGHSIAADGLLPTSRLKHDTSETLLAILDELGGPVDVCADEPRTPSKNDRPKIYIEIGHGPKDGRFDPGAVHASSNITEHSLNLTAADACAVALRAAGYPVDIGDEGESNYQAGRRAKGHDILVSFHHNAAGANAQGAECLYDPRGYTVDDEKLSRIISAHVSQELGIPNRGAKSRRLSVLSGARSVGVPTAVLVEPYFIHQQSPDNPRATLMSEWSKRAGSAVADAVIEFTK